MVDFKKLKRSLKQIEDGVKGTVSALFPFEFDSKEEKLLKNTQLIQEKEIIIKTERKTYNDNVKNHEEKISCPKSLILLVYPDENLSLFQESPIPLTLFMCEKLYESTQYLRIEEDFFFKSKANQIKDFIVPEGKEDDDDIYLINIYLKNNDERFNQRVNQIDRIRAFRELPNLVKDIKISPRLRLEAGKLFNLYHR